jgi:hypothetical protein
MGSVDESVYLLSRDEAETERYVDILVAFGIGLGTTTSHSFTHNIINTSTPSFALVIEQAFRNFPLFTQFHQGLVEGTHELTPGKATL